MGGAAARKGLMGRGAYVLVGATERVAGADSLATLGLTLVRQQLKDGRDACQGRNYPPLRGTVKGPPCAWLAWARFPPHIGIPLQKLGRIDLAGLASA